MRTKMLTMLLAAALVVTVAGPAGAKKPIIEQVGNGSWAPAASGVTFTGTTTGRPLSGDTDGDIAPNDGTLPPWGGCEPGSGTMTTTSDHATLTVTLTGDLCRAVAPAGYLVFIRWYDVVYYTGAKGKRTADGRGGVDLRVLADGSAQWLVQGDLY